MEKKGYEYSEDLATHDSESEGIKKGYITNVEVAERVASKEKERREKITLADRIEAAARNSTGSSEKISPKLVSAEKANDLASDEVGWEVFDAAIKSYRTLGYSEKEAFVLTLENVGKYNKEKMYKYRKDKSAE